jgi:hypothetical protein
MARKSVKKEKDEAAKYLMAALGILLFLPLLIFAVSSFNALQQKYLESTAAQRVMDIRRIFPTLIVGGTVFFVGAIFIYYIINIMNKNSSFSIIAIIIALPAVIFIGYHFARHLAVLYFGIVADKDKDILVFPHDMQSYILSDYFSFRFLKDYCNVDTIELSSITKMTRGHGTELYVHGPFGSRRIIMSTKQKRDECLAMIQVFTGKKGLLITEFEGY